MGNFRNKLIAFLQGSYGFDDFGKFLLYVYILFIILIGIIDIFVNGIFIVIARMIVSLIIIYAIFRIFSKKIYVRRNENEKYKLILKRTKDYFKLLKNKFKDRKTHIYKKCPYCKAVLRLKKIKGNHRAACPKCGKSFNIKV